MAGSRRSTHIPTVPRQLGERHPLLRPATPAEPKQLRSRSVIVLSTPIYINHVLHRKTPLKVHRVEHALRPAARACGGIAPHVTPHKALHVTPHKALHVTPHVRRLVAALQGETGRAELMAALGLADRSHFLRTYLHPSLDAGLIEMTVPQSPRSRNQRYRSTALGRDTRNSQRESEEEGITEHRLHAARRKPGVQESVLRGLSPDS